MKILWLVIILTGTFAQILFKLGLNKIGVIRWINLTSFIQFYLKNFNLYFISGISLTIISFLLWLKILSTNRVSTAFNISALMYIFIPIEAYLFLGEQLNTKFVIGTILITIGVYLSL